MENISILTADGELLQPYLPGFTPDGSEDSPF